MEFKKHHRPCGSIYNLAKTLGIAKQQGSWTEQELATLREFYPLEGLNCAVRLPMHTKEQVKCKAHRLNLCSEVGRKYHNTWTEEELNILMQYYPLEGTACIKRFKNKTKISIANKVHILQLSYFGDYNKPWSADEDKVLLANYENHGPDYCARLLGRTKNACMSRAKQFKLKYKNRYINATSSIWTPQQIEVLVAKYPIYGANIEELNNFSKEQIRSKASSLNLKYTVKKIRCIETGLIFTTGPEAAKNYNIKTSGKITEVCKTGKACGKLPDGTKLHWEYIEEENKDK